MIERYFRSGVRFLWNKPNDGVGPMDGSLIASASAATNLTYDGLDGRRAIVDPMLLNTQASVVLGIAKGQHVPYAWLDYTPGRTAHRPVGGQDVLTGYMSGCLIIRGTFAGVMQVFHVGTMNNLDIDRRVRHTFARDLPADATGFSPLDAWPLGEITMKQAALGGAPVASEKVFALVSNAIFYSILLLNVSEGGSWSNPAMQRYWCVGGIKTVATLSRVNLMSRLMV